MNYEKAKAIIKDKYQRGEITQKQYFKLVSEARARFNTPELSIDYIIAHPEKIFDGTLGI